MRKLALVLALLGLACGQSGTYVVVDLTMGGLPPLTRIDLTVSLPGEPTALVTVDLPAGYGGALEKGLEIRHGEGLLHVDAVAYAGDVAVATGGGSVSVSRGQTARLTIPLGSTPVDAGVPDAADTTDVDATESPDAPLLVTLTADPGGFDFMTLDPAASAQQVFTIKNQGTVASGALHGVITGDAAFVVDDSGCAGVALAPTITCTVTVTYTAVPGASAATLTVADDANQAVVSLHGRGRMPAVLSSNIAGGALDFASVPTGVLRQKTVKISNDGELMTRTLAVQLVGDDAYTVLADACTGDVLGPGDQCSFQVQFAPTVTGQKLATLDVGDGALDLPLAITGSGVVPGSIAIDAVSVMSTQVGKMTSTSVTVRNTGQTVTGTLNLQVQMDPDEYTLATDSCSGKTLGAGGSCTVDVVFTPLSAGQKQAALFVSASPGGANSVTLDAIATAELDVMVVGDGVVSSMPQGISCPSACGAQFSADVLLSATAGAGSMFVGWSVAGCSGSMCRVGLSGQTTSVTATFMALAGPIDAGVVAPVDARPVPDARPPADARPPPDAHVVVPDGPVAIDAPVMPDAKVVPDAFLAPPDAFVPPPPDAFVPPPPDAFVPPPPDAFVPPPPDAFVPPPPDAFVPPPPDAHPPDAVPLPDAATTHVLEVGLNGTSGTVTSTPAGISCTAPGDMGMCSHAFPIGQTVSLTVLNGVMVEWSGACSGSGSCSVTMDADKEVGATISVPMVLLTVDMSNIPPRGVDVLDLEVTSADGFIDCPFEGSGTCSHAYPIGTTVALHGTTSANWGVCAISAKNCSVTLGAAELTVTPAFGLATVTVNVVGTGEVVGAVICNSSDGCVSNSAEVTTGSQSLFAEPKASFQHWTGGCTGSFNSCNFMANDAVTVTATFSP